MTNENDNEVTKGDPLNPDEVSRMHDLHEAFLAMIEEDGSTFSVGVHALARTLAHGGLLLREAAGVSKREFVAGIVESLSQHYDEIADVRRQLND